MVGGVLARYQWPFRKLRHRARSHGQSATDGRPGDDGQRISDGRCCQNRISARAGDVSARTTASWRHRSIAPRRRMVTHRHQPLGAIWPSAPARIGGAEWLRSRRRRQLSEWRVFARCIRHWFRTRDRSRHPCSDHTAVLAARRAAFDFGHVRPQHRRLETTAQGDGRRRMRRPSSKAVSSIRRSKELAAPE